MKYIINKEGRPFRDGASTNPKNTHHHIYVEVIRLILPNHPAETCILSKLQNNSCLNCLFYR